MSAADDDDVYAMGKYSNEQNTAYKQFLLACQLLHSRSWSHATLPPQPFRDNEISSAEVARLAVDVVRNMQIQNMQQCFGGWLLDKKKIFSN